MQKSPLLILLLLWVNILQAQKMYEATYDFQLDKNKFADNFKQEKTQNDKRYNRMLKRMLSSANNTDFSLVFNAERAIFKPIERLTIDNAISDKVGKALLISLDAETKLYTDIACENHFKEVNAGGKTYLVNYPLKTINWKITNSKKSYKNFEIIRATAVITNANGVKTQVEAWFCPKIPARYGPIMFGGLPGLIMQLKAEEKTKKGLRYSFNLTSIEEIDRLRIKIPNDKYEIITNQELQAIFRKMNSNFRPD
ncbi:GLPGLI family protein [Haloflavibacter putidus]|uniref:GLPGLI family protein n=1 Tax=Haloflavibacter putidus TaxID=2576776 RepID=A0A507ZSU1_9FLAO|nr:GLPGLI family protein [Haloflavibacter putidus]TQD40690.1 GLPGLI family protein [Haloflavibacter putidus]